jgi:large subunit ribosomal protein L5
MATAVPTLKALYTDKVRKELQDEFGYKSSMQLPRLEKVIVSMGVGDAISNKKLLDVAVNELSLIAGQRAVKTKAKKSISNFKLREGMEVGCKVTLRGDRMYEFLGRLIDIALPRVKDFRGLIPTPSTGTGIFPWA